VCALSLLHTNYQGTIFPSDENRSESWLVVTTNVQGLKIIQDGLQEKGQEATKWDQISAFIHHMV